MTFGTLMPTRAAVYTLVGLLAALGVARIGGVHAVYTQTYDEPVHIACGMELLQRGTFEFEPLHPPLARTMAGLGPYLAGARLGSGTDPDQLGNAVLYDGHRYRQTLTLARLGILPFFLLATAAVFLWGRWRFDDEIAIYAILLLTTLPPILGHSSLATTDMALAALLFCAVAAFDWWLDNPTPGRSVVAGLALSTALLSKMSALVFFPVCAIGFVASHLVRTRRCANRDPRGWAVWTMRGALLGACAAVGVWAGYGLSMHPLLEPSNEKQVQIALDRLAGSSGWLHDLAYGIARARFFPAPEYVLGFGSATFQTVEGRFAYLLGEVRMGGWWYFFPVALLVKTPLAFLLLAAIGTVAVSASLRKPGRAHGLAILWSSTAILLVSLNTPIQIGVRHVLPIYPFLAFLAALGAHSLARLPMAPMAGKIIVAILLGWQLLSGLRAHPDYLPYFNEIAGSRPEHFLMDSDLDWGQDLDRLERELRARQVHTVHLAYWGTARPEKHLSAAIVPLNPDDPPRGWIAVSLGSRVGRSAPSYAWLDNVAHVARVGKTIDLYFAGEQAGQSSPPVTPRP